MLSVGIIGGGQAGATLLKYFADVEDVKIVGMCDMRDDAPGMLLAKSLKYNTYNSIEDILSADSGMLILEVTGSPKVQGILLEQRSSRQQIMMADGAWLMCQLIDSSKKKQAIAVEKVSHEFSSLTDRMRCNSENIESAFCGIEKVLLELKMTTINASIEAARLGEQGLAFGVVTKGMQEMHEKIESTMGGVSTAAQESKEALRQIVVVEQNLQDVFLE